MNAINLTHRVAVNAFLIYKDRFLFLKRNTHPFIWGPPGGRLNPGEDPISGLKREVREETGLEINVHQPVTTWFGEFNHITLFAVDYLCTATDNVVRLSPEHLDYRWLTLRELTSDPSPYFHEHIGFGLSDFEQAWHMYLLAQKQIERLTAHLQKKHPKKR